MSPALEAFSLDISASSHIVSNVLSRILSLFLEDHDDAMHFRCNHCLLDCTHFVGTKLTNLLSLVCEASDFEAWLRGCSFQYGRRTEVRRAHLGKSRSGRCVVSGRHLFEHLLFSYPKDHETSLEVSFHVLWAILLSAGKNTDRPTLSRWLPTAHVGLATRRTGGNFVSTSCCRSKYITIILWVFLYHGCSLGILYNSFVTHSLQSAIEEDHWQDYH